MISQNLLHTVSVILISGHARGILARGGRDISEPENRLVIQPFHVSSERDATARTCEVFISKHKERPTLLIIGNEGRPGGVGSNFSDLPLRCAQWCFLSGASSQRQACKRAQE